MTWPHRPCLKEHVCHATGCYRTSKAHTSVNHSHPPSQFGGNSKCCMRQAHLDRRFVPSLALGNSSHINTRACALSRHAYITAHPLLPAEPSLSGTLSSVSFMPSGGPSTYCRLSPLAQWRSPFGFFAEKASKNTWPRCDSQRLQMISKAPNSGLVPTWQPPASFEK